MGTNIPHPSRNHWSWWCSQLAIWWEMDSFSWRINPVSHRYMCRQQNCMQFGGEIGEISQPRKSSYCALPLVLFKTCFTPPWKHELSRVHCFSHWVDGNSKLLWVGESRFQHFLPNQNQQVQWLVSTCEYLPFSHPGKVGCPCLVFHQPTDFPKKYNFTPPPQKKTTGWTSKIQ